MCDTGVLTALNCLQQEADNNVKIIVTDKLDAIRLKYDTTRHTHDTRASFETHSPFPPQRLQNRHKKTLQPLLMDILRALSTPNMDIRKKTLDIALDLVSPQNIDEAILYLKKEIAKTQVAGFEKVPGPSHKPTPHTRRTHRTRHTRHVLTIDLGNRVVSTGRC
jgi:hypothetical protein